ncbi:class II fumarate hydratase [Lysobacter soyae]|nr:class II fumarate hydratase [Lysobacter sp. CJ11]
MATRKNSDVGVRIMSDSMGRIEVPAAALWGAQTQRAVENFDLSGQPMHADFIRTLGLLKAVAATANATLKQLPVRTATAIRRAGMEVASGYFDAHFPIDRYQTGSGTSTNMNANEVIASLATRASGKPVHPNDQVNMGQSSNDIIPTAMRVASALTASDRLLPALAHLRKTIARKARAHARTVKTGRTHLMDAMPLTVAQELGAWASQLQSAEDRIKDTLKRVKRLPIGGTAIGTGINAHPRFAATFVRTLNATGPVKFTAAADKFEGIAAQDDLVELSGQLSAAAVALMKISNDLRWMNSGPLAGLAEIELEALQPGSSIMPGKVNPVIPEAVAMACAQIMGLHTANTVAGQSGNFQLNVMLPLLANNLLDAIDLLSRAAFALADDAIANFVVNRKKIDEALARNPILVTALNPIIGYDRAAAIAKRAYKEGRPVLEVALEDSGLDRSTLTRLLEPLQLTGSR